MMSCWLVVVKVVKMTMFVRHEVQCCAVMSQESRNVTGLGDGRQEAHKMAAPCVRSQLH